MLTHCFHYINCIKCRNTALLQEHGAVFFQAKLTENAT